MKSITPTARRALLCTALCLSLATPAAHAAWLGLADGDYALTLNCDLSSVISCPGNLGGSLSIAGGAASYLDVSINGESFVGDPDDTLHSSPLVDFENSSLSHLPTFSFLSLRLITSGQVGSYGVGDMWWVYCHNTGANLCQPGTTGIWSARALNQTPEPTSAALAALALAGLAAMTRRSPAR
jgi:MYXO-CTERM domain-containing protein